MKLSDDSVEMRRGDGRRAFLRGGVMKVIYVAGPYRAQTEWGLVENIRRAEEVAIALWKKGWAVICPHKNTAHFGGLCEDHVWLDGGFEILKRCDAVCLVIGWEKSEGTQQEIVVAKKHGLTIFYSVRQVPYETNHA